MTIAACQCDSVGSSSGYCDERSGQCTCQQNYAGRACGQCANGYYRYPSCQCKSQLTYFVMPYIIYVMLVFTSCWYLRHAGIYVMLVFTSCWYLRHAGIYVMLGFTSCWYLRHAGIYVMLVFTSCWYLRHAGIYVMLVFATRRVSKVNLVTKYELSHRISHFRSISLTSCSYVSGE